MRDIYFDNSATTRVYPEAAELVAETMSIDYGNPSSMHTLGVRSEKYLKVSKNQIAKTLGVSDKEIYFTSGGTESNNWAIIGAAMAMRRLGNHIITSKMEHPSVSETMKYLEKQGFEVSYVGIDPDGNLNLKELEDSVRPDTILISVMIVNNEIGAFTDAGAISEIRKRKCPKAIYHADAVQAYGKYEIRPKRLGIDLMSVSGHKIHGPKGIGFLYKSSGVRILPLIYGGGQQDGLRSGTDNVPGIAGIGKAAEISYSNLNKNREYLYGLKKHLVEKLSELENVVINGPVDEKGAPHIVNASFVGVGSEVMLHSLEDKGIYVSAGSACSTHKRSKSPTLSALGVSDEIIGSAIRFSFSEYNTTEEIDIAVGEIKKLLPVLRRYRSY
ncbi:MAG: cysteine desulfurase family protein [Lachnospiraceae bacterium]